jgi:hypothetical protein
MGLVRKIFDYEMDRKLSEVPLEGVKIYELI